MLDLLERWGIDLDGLDNGHSLRLHAIIAPRAKPQSICSRLVELQLWGIVWLIGFDHCARSWDRYHNGETTTSTAPPLTGSPRSIV